MRLLRLLLLALLPVAGVAATAAPATAACEAPTRPFPAQLEAAEAVFSGVVASVRPGVRDSRVITVRVGRVWAGSGLTGDVRVRTTTDDCGLAARPGQEWLLLAGRDDRGRLASTQPSGSRLLSPEVEAAVVRELGEGRAEPAPAPPAQPELTMVADSEPRGFWSLALPGLLLLGGGLVLWVAARLLGRRRGA